MSIINLDVWCRNINFSFSFYRKFFINLNIRKRCIGNLKFIFWILSPHKFKFVTIAILLLYAAAPTKYSLLYTVVPLLLIITVYCGRRYTQQQRDMQFCTLLKQTSGPWWTLILQFICIFQQNPNWL